MNDIEKVLMSAMDRIGRWATTREIAREAYVPWQVAEKFLEGLFARCRADKRTHRTRGDEWRVRIDF